MALSATLVNVANGYTYKENQKNGRCAGVCLLCSPMILENLPTEVNSVLNRPGSEWCIRAVDSMVSPCNMCNIPLHRFKKFFPFNLQDCHRRLLTKRLPGSKNQDQSLLTVRVNGELWSQHCVRLAAWETLNRVSAPSGNQGKGRSSRSNWICFTSQVNADLLMMVCSDISYYQDPQTEPKIPTQNMVGFWLCPEYEGGERNLLQLNDQNYHRLVFGFSCIDWNTIESISVTLQRSARGKKTQRAEIWRYSVQHRQLQQQHLMGGSPSCQRPRLHQQALPTLGSSHSQAQLQQPRLQQPQPPPLPPPHFLVDLDDDQSSVITRAARMNMINGLQNQE